MKTREVECFRCWDDGTWDTAFIDIPGDTPDNKLQQAVQDAASKIKWTDEVPWFVGIYNSKEDDES